MQISSAYKILQNTNSNCFQLYNSPKDMPNSSSGKRILKEISASPNKRSEQNIRNASFVKVCTKLISFRLFELRDAKKKTILNNTHKIPHNIWHSFDSCVFQLFTHYSALHSFCPPYLYYCKRQKKMFPIRKKHVFGDEYFFFA